MSSSTNKLPKPTSVTASLKKLLKKSKSNSKKEIKKNLEVQKWYHGLRTRPDVESLLKEKGEFLVRATDSDGVNKIVISFHTGKRIVHLTIGTAGSDKWQLLVQKQNLHRKTFSTVYELVRYYQSHRFHLHDDGDLRLTKPVVRPKWFVHHAAIKYNKSEPPLGSGNFSDVYLGTFNTGTEAINVAIKVMKTDDEAVVAGREAKVLMLREAKLMSYYNNRNVVKFYGIACDRPPVMIVMEYCPGGSLDNHLKNLKENIVVGERMTYCIEAAFGMRYLHYKNCLHRDLSARNCLISSDGIIKIADFGLSKGEGIAEEDEVKMSHVPIRWMAPETLTKKPLFSKKSDIWAYGILVYEIFNLGEKPWPDEEFKKIAKNIRRCNMVTMPDIAPKVIKDLISLIWVHEPDQRPTFETILTTLIESLKDSLAPPIPDDYSVNQIPNVKRTEQVKEDVQEDFSTMIFPTMLDETDPTAETMEESEKRKAKKKRNVRAAVRVKTSTKR